MLRTPSANRPRKAFFCSRHSGLEPESRNLSRKLTSCKRFHKAVGFRVKPGMTKLIFLGS